MFEKHGLHVLTLSLGILYHKWFYISCGYCKKEDLRDYLFEVLHIKQVLLYLVVYMMQCRI